MDNLILEQTVTIEYQCRDIGHGIESGEATGRFTGEIDAWGKHTFHPDGGKAPLYLFADEILSCVATNTDPSQHQKALVN
jgi:hypothetical protein